MGSEAFMVLVSEAKNLVPRRTPHLPNVFVTVVFQPDGNLQAAFEKKRKAKSERARSLVKPLSISPLGTFDTKIDAKAHADELKRSLAEQGYTVNPTPSTKHVIYVVRLDAQKLGRPEQKCVYVGQTSKTAEERIAIHRAGGRHAAKTWRAFLKRAQNLEPPPKPIHSKWDAEAEEVAWGEHLRALGYHVEGPGFRTVHGL